MVLCNHDLVGIKVTLIGYNVIVEMTETFPIYHFLGGMQVILIWYSITMEIAEPDSISCNHSKKGVKKLTCRHLLGCVTAKKSMLVCVFTDKLVNIAWNHHEDKNYKTARKDVRNILLTPLLEISHINSKIKQKCLHH